MTNNKYIIPFLVAIFCSHAVSQQDSDFLPTKAGNIKITGQGLYKQLIIDKTVILDNVMSVDFLRKFQLHDADIIAVEVANGGNGACSVDYYFITARKANDINISPAISCHAEAELSVKQIGDITFSGEISKIKGKGFDKYLYDYKTGILTLNGKEIKSKPRG